MGVAGFGSTAPACSDRIDEDEIGDFQPWVWIVVQPRRGGSLFRIEVHHLRPDKPEMQIGR